MNAVTGGRRRALTMSALGLALVLGLGACGDDDDETASDTTAASDGGGSTEDSGGGDLEAACDAYIEVTQAFGEEADPSVVAPLLDEIEDNAPGNIPEELQTTIDIAREAIGGDPSAVEGEEFQQALATSNAYIAENCDVEQASVTAVNYAYEDAPGTLPSGTVALTLDNEGTELHEAVLIRRNDDTTESFDELLELSEEEAFAKVSVSGAAFAGPGESGVAFVELEAGDYAMVCFIPVGTVDFETEVDGPPHFTQGMVHEFSVE